MEPAARPLALARRATLHWLRVGPAVWCWDSWAHSLPRTLSGLTPSGRPWPHTWLPLTGRAGSCPFRRWACSPLPGIPVHPSTTLGGGEPQGFLASPRAPVCPHWGVSVHSWSATTIHLWLPRATVWPGRKLRLHGGCLSAPCSLGHLLFLQLGCGWLQVCNWSLCLHGRSWSGCMDGGWLSCPSGHPDTCQSAETAAFRVYYIYILP